MLVLKFILVERMAVECLQ